MKQTKQHVATVTIPYEEFNRVNRLLAINDMEQMTDGELIALGANTNVNEGIYLATFDDGSSINFDLCSGSSNYYDDVVWTSPDGATDVILECDFALDDIEFDIDGETYIVQILKD